MQTIAGTVTTNRYVSLSEISLPEFDKSKLIDGNMALVFDTDCQYDIIAGRDFLEKNGLKLDFQAKTMLWLDLMVAMKSYNFWSSSSNYLSILDEMNDDIVPTQHFESFKAQALTKLLKSDYKAVAIKDVVDIQKYLIQIMFSLNTQAFLMEPLATIRTAKLT